MRKFTIFLAFVAGLFAASCSTTPEISDSIPDHAFAVASVHPKMMFDKGQISSFDSFISEMPNEILRSVIKDPAESGLVLSNYAYLFGYFEGENPVIGITALVEDTEKLGTLINKLTENQEDTVYTVEEFSVLAPDKESGSLAWNDKQMIMLISPDNEYSREEWEEQLLALFDLPKEEAVTSIVDFNDFRGKMKDLNFWFTGDELQKLLEKSGAMDEMEINFPFALYNNYGQVYIEFVDGAMYVHGETHLSDDVEKATSTFIVGKEKLNEEMIKLAPGNNLLLAMAYSVELEKLAKLLKGIQNEEMGEISGKLEESIGVSGNEILESLNGDFVISVNGAPEGSAIPVDIMIGIGLKDESLQDKLIDQAENMAEVQKEGDFFTINANGIEIYSGIVKGIWVITNVKGYKAAVTNGGLEKTLYDSKFNEFSNGNMGMYLNLDVTTYPAALQNMVSSGGAPEFLELITESLSYLGVEATNLENDMTLITAKEDENSLYTLLKLIEAADK